MTLKSEVETLQSQESTLQTEVTDLQNQPVIVTQVQWLAVVSGLKAVAAQQGNTGVLTNLEQAGP